MPRRGDIDPMDIPDLLPGICLLDVGNLNRPACEVKFRLAGNRVRDMIGYDVTGRSIEELFDSPTVEKMMENYQLIAKTLEPHYEKRRKPISDVTTAIYERVLAPLGEEGQAPEMFFGMHVVAMEGHKPLDGDLPVG